MTVRKVEIDRLELRLGTGTVAGTDRSAHALEMLGQEVASRLAERLGPTILQDTTVGGAASRRIELTVSGGAANPGRIAEAVKRRMLRGARIAARRGR